MKTIWSRVCRVVIVLALVSPAGLAPGPTALAATPDGALIGIWPDQNLSTVDTLDQSTVAAVTPGAYTQPQDLSYIPAMNAWQGKPNSIIQFYDSVDSNAFSSWAPIIWDNYHAIPMMTMNTGGSSPSTNAQVAAGSNDSQILGYANALKSWITGTDVLGAPAPAGGRRMFIRMNWEGNGNWYAWSPTNTATDCTSLLQLEHDYAAAWRHVHDLVMGVGLTSAQVGWVFSVNSADAVPPALTGCANGSSDVTKNIFPGDAYVDWTGIDGYAFCSAQSPSQIFASMVSELRTISTRPLSANEVGASTAGVVGTCGSVANKARWISAYLDYIQASDIKMAVWFNANIYETSRPTDWAVFSQPGPQDIASAGDCTYASSAATTYNTYCEYPQGLSAPFYATLDPSNTRIVSDAEFEGTWTRAAGGTAPSAPSLSTHSAHGQVTLGWSKPADGGVAITGYQVLRGTAPGGETLLTTLDAWDRSYTDTAVTGLTTYYYQVKAVNAIGAGAASNEATAVPQKGAAIVGLWADQNIGSAGLQAPSQHWQPSSTSYVPAMNAWQGKANSVINFQSSLDPNAFYYQVPNIWDGYHAIPMMSLDTSNSTNAQVVAGAQDLNIYQFGEALQTWINGTDALGKLPPVGGRRIYLRLNWEGNGTANKWAPLNTATDCASLLQAEQDYVGAWRRAHDILGMIGMTSSQVSWVFSVNQVDLVPPALRGCANGASDVTAKIYPGDAYVDWTGVDGFSYCSSQTPAQVFDPMVSKLKSISTRPVSIDQVGASSAQLLGNCRATTPAAKGAWLTSYLNYLQTSGIKMSVWDNADVYTTSPVDWAVFSQANLPQDIASRGDCTYSPSALVTYNVYCEYAAALAGAYFAGADAADPQVVGDAEFEGTWN